MAGFVRVIWVWREEVYFFNRGWTGQITLKSLRKIDLSRKIDFRARHLFVEPAEQSRAADCLTSAPIDPGRALKNIGRAQGSNADLCYASGSVSAW